MQRTKMLALTMASVIAVICISGCGSKEDDGNLTGPAPKPGQFEGAGSGKDSVSGSQTGPDTQTSE